MPPELRETTINGRKYTTMQLDPTRALALEARVAPLLAGGIAPLVAAWGKGDEIQLAAIDQAIRSITEKLDPETYTKLVVDLCELAAFEGKKLSFDAHFANVGDPREKYRVAFFVLEANLGGFIEGLGISNLAARAREAMAGPVPEGAATH